MLDGDEPNPFPELNLLESADRFMGLLNLLCDESSFVLSMSLDVLAGEFIEEVRLSC